MHGAIISKDAKQIPHFTIGTGAHVFVGALHKYGEFDLFSRYRI